MALRNQPYFPMYVQDFLSDEKLNECSAKSTGVYIRLMCIMHKSDEYGVILLKQKDKQTDNQIKNFAIKLVKQMPYIETIIEESLEELINEKVLILDEDKLIQKRMVRDNEISEKRALAGSKGGKITQKNNEENNGFAKAKSKSKGKAKEVTNSEYEIEYEIVIENKSKDINYYENKELNNIFIDFLEIRKKLKAINSERAVNSLIKKLSKYSDDIKIQMIDKSITNSWKDVFPLKETDKSIQKTEKTQSQIEYERTQEILKRSGGNG